MQVHCSDLPVFIGGVIIDSLPGVAARGIYRKFKLIFTKMDTAPGLLHAG